MRNKSERNPWPSFRNLRTPYGAGNVTPPTDVDKGVSPETIQAIADRMDDDAPTSFRNMPEDLHAKCKAMLNQLPDNAPEITDIPEFKPPSREDAVQKYLDRGYEVVQSTGKSRF